MGIFLYFIFSKFTYLFLIRKKMNYKKTITALFLFFFVLQSFGQRVEKIIINLNVDSGLFNAADVSEIPFDEIFYIKGTTANEQLKKVTVKYKPLGGFTNKHYFVKDIVKYPRDSDGYVTIGTYNIINKTFQFASHKLHPNENYEFIFLFEEKLILDKAKNDELRLNILTKVEDAYGFDVDRIPEGTIANLGKDISNEIKKATNNKPLYGAENVLISDVGDILDNDTPLQDSFNVIDSISGKMYVVQKGITIADVGRNRYGTIYNILENYKAQKTVLQQGVQEMLNDAHFKDIIAQPANASLSNQQTLKSVLEFIYYDCLRSSFDLRKTAANFSNERITDLKNTNSYIFDILLGKAKLKGIIVEPSSGYDITSVEVLLSGLIQLQNAKKADGNVVIAADTLDPLMEALTEWIKKVSEIEQKQGLIDQEKQRSAVILEGIYSKFSLKIEEDTQVDIESKESPYLGLDFGILVAPEINSTFVFQGVNFHLSPVNRRANFSDLEGLDFWAKRISFSLGVAQRIGSYEDSYENLIAVGSPFAGVGFRINRMLRINGGVLFYKKTDSNPVISDKVVTGTYFFSASVDIKLKEAFKFIGTFF